MSDEVRDRRPSLDVYDSVDPAAWQLPPDDGAEPVDESTPPEPPDPEDTRPDNKQKSTRKNKMKALFSKKKKEKPETCFGDEGAVVTKKSGKSKNLFKKFKKTKKGKQGKEFVPSQDEEDRIMGEVHKNNGTGDTMPSEPRQMDTHAGSYSVNPSETLTRTPSRGEVARSSFKAMWKRPAKEAVDVELQAELKKPPAKSKWRCSVIIVVILLVGFVIGIILTALAGDNAAMQVIGPCFIGLSLFALVGKIFFTLFFDSEPHPALAPFSRMFDKAMRKKEPGYEHTTASPVEYTMATPAASIDRRSYDYSQPANVKQEPTYMMDNPLYEQHDPSEGEAHKAPTFI